MGVLDRLVLDDNDWSRIAPHIIGDERSRGSSGRDNRMFVEAVLWIVRTGPPWRDLPEEEKAYNRGLSSFRVAVEHRIGRTKRFRMVVSPVVVSELWVSGLPERPPRVWRRRATYPQRWSPQCSWVGLGWHTQL